MASEHAKQVADYLFPRFTVASPASPPEVAELAQENARNNNYAAIRIQQAIDAATAELRAENERLRRCLTAIRDDFDCDSDAHKYGTTCRCCFARAALAAKGGE